MSHSGVCHVEQKHGVTSALNIAKFDFCMLSERPTTDAQFFFHPPPATLKFCILFKSLESAHSSRCSACRSLPT